MTHFDMLLNYNIIFKQSSLAPVSSPIRTRLHRPQTASNRHSTKLHKTTQFGLSISINKITMRQKAASQKGKPI